MSFSEEQELTLGEQGAPKEVIVILACHSPKRSSSFSAQSRCEPKGSHEKSSCGTVRCASRKAFPLPLLAQHNDAEPGHSGDRSDQVGSAGDQAAISVRGNHLFNWQRASPH